MRPAIIKPRTTTRGLYTVHFGSTGKTKTTDQLRIAKMLQNQWNSKIPSTKDGEPEPIQGSKLEEK